MVGFSEMPSYPRFNFFFGSVFPDTDLCCNDSFGSLTLNLFKELGLNVVTIFLGHLKASVKKQVKGFAMDDGIAIVFEHLEDRISSHLGLLLGIPSRKAFVVRILLLKIRSHTPKRREKRTEVIREDDHIEVMRQHSVVKVSGLVEFLACGYRYASHSTKRLYHDTLSLD